MFQRQFPSLASLKFDTIKHISKTVKVSPSKVQIGSYKRYLTAEKLSSSAILKSWENLLYYVNAARSNAINKISRFFIDDFPIILRYDRYYRELSQMFDIIEKDNKRAVDPLCPCYAQFIEVQLTRLSN